MSKAKPDTWYVLDTSVLVHDPTAPGRFRGNHVAIPIFAVMELDELKNSRRHEVAMASRAASRFIANLREFGDLHAADGVYDEEADIHYYVVANGEGRGVGALWESSEGRKMDALILSSAMSLRDLHPKDRVVLVSKDVNLRIIAEVEGLLTEDYETDRVDIGDVYRGYHIQSDFDAEIAQRAYYGDGHLSPADLGVEVPLPNGFVVLRRDGTDMVLRYHRERDALVPVARDVGAAAGVSARNIEQRMALDLLMDPDVELVTLVGKAGTGKTFLAVAAAIAQLSGRRGPEQYDRILLSKPVIPMGKDIGYLPGDFDAKMEPWMMSFFDNLDQVIPTVEHVTSKGGVSSEKSWEYLFHSGQLEVQAIHSIRGRSIPKAFMIIDEAQNLTPHEVKTIITRAAEGTKIVLCGDPFQVDNHFLDAHSNGLVYVAERLKKADGTGTVFFTRGERSRLAELAATML